MATRLLGWTLAALLVAFDATALSLNEAFRTVAAEATATYWLFDAAGSTFTGLPTSDEHEASTLATGPYSKQVGADADTGVGGLASSAASLESDLLVVRNALWAGGVGGTNLAFEAVLIDPDEQTAVSMGLSQFRIAFSVDRDTPFHLDYTLTSIAGPIHSGESGSASIYLDTEWTLHGVTSGTVGGDAALCCDSVSDSSLLTLAPDTYTFSIFAISQGGVSFDGFASGTAGFSFDLHVPEPATLLLLGLAAIAIGWRRARS